MILIYDVNDGMWESKGNFQTAKEDNYNIFIQPTDNGQFNLDILCVSFLYIYIILFGLKFYSLSLIPQSLYLPSPLLLSITTCFHFKQKQLQLPLLLDLDLDQVLHLPCILILNLSPLPL